MQPGFDIEMFYLGKLCPRGHDYKKTGKSLLYVIGRNCAECAIARTREYIKNNKKYVRRQRKIYYDKNKGALLEKTRKYQRENKEKIARQRAIYVQDNKEAFVARSAAHYLKNKTRIKENVRKYRKKNRALISSNSNEYNKKQVQMNTEYALRGRLRRRVSMALAKYTKTGKIWTSQQYGIDYKAIIKHIGPHPNIRGIKGDFHIDHIIPVSAFDLNDPGQIVLAFAPGNHRWCLAKENMSKHNRIEGQLTLMTQPQLEAVINAAG